MIILSRQARDKHRESTQKRDYRLLAAAAARQSAVAAGAVTIAGGDGDSGPTAAATATSTTSRPAAATATAISNVFSGGDSILRHGLPGMHSAGMKMH
jgi:hypothetical protein